MKRLTEEAQKRIHRYQNPPIILIQGFLCLKGVDLIGALLLGQNCLFTSEQRPGMRNHVWFNKKEWATLLNCTDEKISKTVAKMEELGYIKKEYNIDGKCLGYYVVHYNDLPITAFKSHLLEESDET